MNISIVIPTYNRVKDLEECLNSISNQTKLPGEVIIVDDSDNDRTKKLIKKIKLKFQKKKITLKYIKNDKRKSLTVARNIGIENSKGDIILFLDDDVILDKRYIEELLKVYKKHRNAVGVQGYITNIKPVKSTFFRKFFFLLHSQRNMNKVLPSFEIVYAYPLTKVIRCQWLTGSNQSYKKEIFDEFKFDEKLIGYSFKEDIDLSYRVYRKYPNGLYQTPNAKLIHKGENMPKKKILPRKLIYMYEVYSLYFFYKNIDQTLKNKLIYIWSRIGRIIGATILFFLHPSKLRLKHTIDLISADVYCLLHINEIKHKRLDFFDVGFVNNSFW